MNSSPVWDLEATRKIIGKLYGKDQLLLARQSLNSAIDRRDFAHFHFHEAMKRWDQHLIDVKDCDPIEAVFGSGDDEIDDERARRMHELGAHVHACVQSLHTIPDIMAHGLYYGLALNQPSPLGERAISAKSVTEKLAGDPSLHGLQNLLKLMYSSGNFEYLDALNNHGKHRSIVQTAVWADLTGESKDPISLKFSGFKYSGTQRDGRDIRTVLTSEYERLARCIIDCGIELFSILERRKVAASFV